jgi:hypothetical protein
MREWIDSVTKLFERPRSEPMTPLANYIARHGGLKLDGDARAADFHKVFIPGAGPLARKNGKSIDDFWRTNLADNGFIERDPDGYMSRDIRTELYDLLHAEQMKRHFGTSNNNAQERLDHDTAEYEDLQRQAYAELVQGGHTDVDPELFSTATQMMWRGDYDNVLDAYERAAMMAGHEMKSNQKIAGDIPF